jgi:hypothetical protein
MRKNCLHKRRPSVLRSCNTLGPTIDEVSQDSIAPKPPPGELRNHGVILSHARVTHRNVHTSSPGVLRYRHSMVLVTTRPRVVDAEPLCATRVCTAPVLATCVPGSVCWTLATPALLFDFFFLHFFCHVPPNRAVVRDGLDSTPYAHFCQL